MAVESAAPATSIGFSTFYVQQSDKATSSSIAKQKYDPDKVTISALSSKLHLLAEKIQRFKDHLQAMPQSATSANPNPDGTSDPLTTPPDSENVAERSAQAGILLSDLKDVMKAFHAVTRLLKDETGSKGGFSFTAKDEELAKELAAAFEGAKSADGTFSLSNAVSLENFSTAVQEDVFTQGFANNPQAVVETILKLHATVAGAAGIVRRYSTSDGLLAQGYAEILEKRAKVADMTKRIQAQSQDALTSEDLKLIEKLTKQISVTES